ncbi:MAG: hypothetical protein COB37_00420 [Kordiimonadales bacterium]|nr:MAG: hypothetical protein COB37_00420 [Kordiimonadales bacterium]
MGSTTATMIIVIVAIVFGTGLIKSWLKTRQKEAATHTHSLDKEAKEKIAGLEERIQVLERIATDKGARLKDEIDAL